MYKDAQILGPYDRDAMAGVPGLDAATLVCLGDASAPGEGDWRPAGDVGELAELPLRAERQWRAPSAAPLGLLDSFPLDAPAPAAGTAASAALFQPAAPAAPVGGWTAPPPGPDPELSTARARASDLARQLEEERRRAKELEDERESLRRRLVEAERAAAAPPAPPPQPPELPVLPAFAFPSSPAPSAGAESPPVEPEAARLEPEPAVRFEPPPPEPEPAAKIELAPAAPRQPEAAAEPGPAAEPSPEIPALPPAPAADAAEPSRITFTRRTFKTAPTIRSLRVAEGGSAEPSEPAPAPLAGEPPAEAPAAASPPPAPEPAAPPAPAPIDTAFAPSFEPSFSPPATPPPGPPATLMFSRPAPSETSMPRLEPAAEPSGLPAEPPDAEPAPSRRTAEQVLARLSKPAPAPVPGKPAAPSASRGNRKFMAVAAVLIAAMAGAGFLFLRQPAELRQMAEMDDGRSRVGTVLAEDAPAPAEGLPVDPLAAASLQAGTAAPTGAAPAQPAPAPPPAVPEPGLEDAVRAVKDFPLDGGRGTVAQWLQYSYSASPGAGRESWTASRTLDTTYLVEYRFTPAAPGASEAHYLFEIDLSLGLVSGKNMDARSMLAGGPGRKADKPRAPARKKAARRAVRPARRAPARAEAPPPLPEASELRPPSAGGEDVSSGL